VDDDGDEPVELEITITAADHLKPATMADVLEGWQSLNELLQIVKKLAALSGA
jgi:hypothetical protein